MRCGADAGGAGGEVGGAGEHDQGVDEVLKLYETIKQMLIYLTDYGGFSFPDMGSFLSETK